MQCFYSQASVKGFQTTEKPPKKNIQNFLIFYFFACHFCLPGSIPRSQTQLNADRIQIRIRNPAKNPLEGNTKDTFMFWIVFYIVYFLWDGLHCTSSSKRKGEQTRKILQRKNCCTDREEWRRQTSLDLI